MSVYIVVSQYDYEGYAIADPEQAYETREEAIENEVPKSCRKTLNFSGGNYEVIEIILPGEPYENHLDHPRLF